MRFRSILDRREHGIDIAMTPMIDVVFMLLIFFVWTASFQVVELLLPSNLVSQDAEAGTTQLNQVQDDLERIVVRVIGLGTAGLPTWTVNDVSLDEFGQVIERLNAIAKIRSSLPVLVDPDADVALGYVIDVYDAARSAGFENVQFTTPATE